MDRSIEWYVAVFGLQQLDDERASDGSWRIVNLATENLFVELIWDNRDRAVERARGFAKVGFGVASADELAARVEKATGKSPKVVEAVKQGLRIVQLRDPDGNILQFSSKTAPPSPPPRSR
jgi:predicted enzyme related to lactoylglutathione lyase